MLRFLLIAMLLLLVGCDYFSDGSDNPVADSTPAILPADADWELIATLQRNPLAPGMFYIFPEQSEAMNNAYEGGKHFIFEVGEKYKEGYTYKIRHYIIQPYMPFQDEYKPPWVQISEEKSGIKWHTHRYFFRSEGEDWYVPLDYDGRGPNESQFADHSPYAEGRGGIAIGFGVEFDITHTEPRGQFTGEGTDHWTRIGLVAEPFGGLGSGKSYIEESTRLRIYVSR